MTNRFLLHKEREFKMKRFRFLEHTADAYIETYGGSLEEAFENAGAALVDVMTELDKVEAVTKESFVIEAQDEAALLYSWLEELLLEFELKGRLYSHFEVTEIKETSEGFRLHAKAWGEQYSADKHPTKVGIKAATYHQMEIVKKPNSVVLRFILDI
ncbi:MAG: archease [Candidatus Bathyarchaeum sp.]|nr:MAG: archease [Candidatus Bathyarchaeum sp.]